MAMVRRKVSNVLMKSTHAFGSKFKELKPMTTRKRMANQGMLILLPPLPSASRSATFFATKKAMTNNTGTNIITRIILTIIAELLTAAPIALPAPTT